MNNRDLAEEIYKDLNEKGADLGNVSVVIIEKTLNKHLNKFPLDYTGWITDVYIPTYMVYCKEGRIQYGFSVSGYWFVSKRKTPFTEILSSYEACHTEDVCVRLKEYAQSIGLKKGAKVKTFSTHNGVICGDNRNCETAIKKGEFWAEIEEGVGVQLLNEKGEWATPIEEETKNQK